MMATYKFNPADQSWLKLEGFPFRNDSYGAGSTVMGDTLYLVGGYTYSANIMHAFDPNSNTWRRLGDFNPRQVGVLLGLGKSLWFGMAFPYGGSSTFWEISSLNKYSYTTKGAFPVTSPATFASYFTTANRGYVILANNQVWQFNPNDLTWTRKNDFPGSARYMATSFVIGNYAYFGLGRNSSSSTQVYDDIWKYDILADTWSLATRIPVRRYSATVFTINNKAYIGFGINTEKELYDFYEYDPAH
jgi:N-acetylneuraminic acid mutarotase